MLLDEPRVVALVPISVENGGEKGLAGLTPWGVTHLGPPVGSMQDVEQSEDSPLTGEHLAEREVEKSLPTAFSKLGSTFDT